MALFDRYLIVDWSAANTPKTGKDSIWIALFEGTDLKWVRNSPTRLVAIELIRDIMAETVAAGQKLFTGFDFAFGYPQGAAQRIGEHDNWQSIWQALADLIIDDEHNKTNTYEIAGHLNQSVFGGLTDGPFWGHPYQHAGRYAGLGPTKPVHAFGSINEFRRVERANKGAKSLWQMAGAGVVAAQSMTGIKHLQNLRHDAELKEHIAIWPFETGFVDDLSKTIIIAEIYPSIFDCEPHEGEVKDAAQVRTVGQCFSQADHNEDFKYCIDCPDDLSGADYNAVLREEGWIVRAPKPDAPQFDYIRDPAAIYEKSFEIVRSEANLSNLPSDIKDVAVRLVHACGMVDIVDDLAFSSDAAQAGRIALSASAPIICDVEMVRHGIIQRHLKNKNDVLCAVADEATRSLAQTIQNTRSAAAMDILKDRIKGSIIVIGNAPTALFRVLELAREGTLKPALIIGMPVGFVGAAESKEALIGNEHNIPYIVVRGRRGGSAMASATLNALAAGLKGGL